MHELQGFLSHSYVKPWCRNDTLVQPSLGSQLDSPRLHTELHLMEIWLVFWQAQCTKQDQEKKETILRLSALFVTLNLLGMDLSPILLISAATRGPNNIWCRSIVAAMGFPAICGPLACPCAAGLSCSNFLGLLELSFKIHQMSLPSGKLT